MNLVSRVIIVYVSMVGASYADLSDYAPEDLCDLLEPFGLETELRPEGEPNWLCRLIDQPTDQVDDGYEYFYSVIRHWTYDHVNNVVLSIRGRPEVILDSAPYDQLIAMSNIVLSVFFSDQNKLRILERFSELTPNEIQVGHAQGIGIQLTYQLQTIEQVDLTWVDLNIRLSNMCMFFPIESDRQQECLNERAILTWEDRTR